MPLNKDIYNELKSTEYDFYNTGLPSKFATIFLKPLFY